MNKKLMIAGAGILAVAAYFTLTAFGGGKTLEQQKQEIATAITARLDEFRAQKEEECTAKVTAEGQKRYQDFVASQPAETPKGAPGKTVKKPKGGTVKKEPLPQTPPNPGVDRPGATRKDAPAAPVERPGAVKKDAAPAPVERPGATRKPGGK